MPALLEAFFRIPGQWLGISCVIGFSTFFMLWVSYGIIVRYTPLRDYHLRLRTFVTFFLAAFLAMMAPLGINFWVQRHYLSQETSIQEAYQYIVSDDMKSLDKTVDRISAVPLLLRSLDKYRADNLEAEIAGFKKFQSQRQGRYSSSEPEFSEITPPIEWITRAEFFLNQGNTTQAGEQLGAILAKTETAPLACNFILLLLNHLEKAGQINKAKDLGKVVLIKLKNENINPDRDSACKLLFEKLGVWFPEDPSLY